MSPLLRGARRNIRVGDRGRRQAFQSMVNDKNCVSLIKGLLYSVIAMSGAGFSATCAAQIPLDPVEFSAVVAQALREKVDPAIAVSTPAPLVLQVEVAGQSVSLPFDAVHARCIALSGFCRDSVRLYVAAAIETLAGAPANPSATQLRVLLRHRLFVEQLGRGNGSSRPPPPVAKPFTGDLWMVLALAGKHVQWLVPHVMLERLGLDPSAAFELALKNTRAALPPLSHVVRPLGSSGFSHVYGDSVASRLLLAEDWRAVAARKPGELVAMVPDTDNVIFGVVQSLSELNAFKDLATEPTRLTGHPRTATIYRWRNEAWEPLAEEQLVREGRLGGAVLQVP